MNYLPETVTISADVSGYADGDYCYAHSNDGAGAIDWDTPHDARKIPLTSPEYTTLGWGRGPWGRGAWGRGYTTMTVTVAVAIPGYWLFGFMVYDQYGNEHVGTPGQAGVSVCLTPVRPDPLTITSYNSTTDLLILAAT